MAGEQRVEKLTVSVTVVAAVIVAGLSWWANAQQSQIDKNKDDIAAVKQEQAADKLNVYGKINGVSTQVTVQSTQLQLMQDTLKEIRDELRRQREDEQ